MEREPRRIPRASGTGGALVSQSPRGLAIHAPAPIPGGLPTVFRRFKVTGVQDDYLECHTYDLAPDGSSTEGATTINVAKPYPLRGGGGAYEANDIIVAAKNIRGDIGEDTCRWEDVVSAGGGGGGGAAPSAGTGTSNIKAAGGDDPGSSGNFANDDHLHDLHRTAVNYLQTGGTHASGLKMTGDDLGIIFGEVGYMEKITGAATSAGDDDAVARIDHIHDLDVADGVQWDEGVLKADWSNIEVDNDTIKYDGGIPGIYVSRILVSGDFSMENDANLAHKEVAAEPIYSTGSGLGLEIGNGLELTGSGPATLIAHIDASTIRFDGTGAMYVDGSELSDKPALSDQNPEDVDGLAADPGTGTEAARDDHHHDMQIDAPLYWNGPNLGLALHTNGGLVVEIGELLWKMYRVSQAATPTPAAGEAMMHHDTDDGKVYFVYNDPTVGVKQVELT